MTVQPIPGHTAKLINREGFRWMMRATKHRTDGGPDCSSIPKLALACGKSPAVIGFLWSDGKSARDTCSIDLANAICDASGVPFPAVFVVVPKSDARKKAAA